MNVYMNVFPFTFLSFRENLLSLDIFFRDLSYEIVEERPAYDLTQLLSRSHSYSYSFIYSYSFVDFTFLFLSIRLYCKSVNVYML